MKRLRITALLLLSAAPLIHASTIVGGIDVPYTQEFGDEEFSFALTSLDGTYSVSGIADCCAGVAFGAYPLGATVSLNMAVQTESSLGSATVNGVTYPSTYGGPDLRFTLQPFTITGAGKYSVPFQLTSPGNIFAGIAGEPLSVLVNDSVQGSGVVTFSLVQTYCVAATLCISDPQDLYLANGDVSFIFSSPDPAAPEPSTWLTMTLGSLVLALGMKRLKSVGSL
jgi:hypothetical protein